MLYVISNLTTQLFQHFALKVGLLDVPNARSAHQTPTARGGGVVFVLFGAAWLIGSYWVGSLTLNHGLVLMPAFAVAGVGFWDDHQSLSALTRFLCHIGAAAVVLLIYPPASWLLMAFLGGILLWSTSLFNFMDGLDGLAATEAIFVLGVGGWLLQRSGATDLSQWTFCLIALIAGFLRWNWPKASLFMGDVGSGFLGFMNATLAVIGYVEYHLSLVYWFILYGTFWFDASLTLLRRLYGRELIFKPHKQHTYQRLYQSGFSQKQVLWCSIGLNSVLAILTIFAYYYPKYLMNMLCLAVTFLLLIYLQIEKRNNLMD